jgi:CTD kinase subunit beta
MSPAKASEKLEPKHVGPHPSYIQVARPYVFEQKLQECMNATGVSEAKEDVARLQGVQWIDNVRRALKL